MSTGERGMINGGAKKSSTSAGRRKTHGRRDLLRRLSRARQVHQSRARHAHLVFAGWPRRDVGAERARPSCSPSQHPGGCCCVEIMAETGSWASSTEGVARRSTAQAAKPWMARCREQ